ncbi:MAG: M3 family oligoendopeptidase, partial [Clostridia bacterium]|nr:M3 family oligoendopeptidase [Clostridia bacterium]
MRIKVRDLPYSRVDVKLVEDAVNKFVEAEKTATSAEEVLKAREEMFDAFEEFNTNSSIASARYTLNTRDDFYVAEQEYYDEVYPIIGDLYNTYAKVMLNSRFRPELEQLVPETVYPCLVYSEKAHSPEVIADEQEENAIITKYTQLLSQLTTEWRGEQKTIAYIRGFFEDKDREVRKQAAEAVDRALATVGDELDNIYDHLVKVRTRIASKLGYDNFVELGYYRMSRIDYDKDMVAKFRENVLKSIVPVVTEMKKGIAKSLDIEKMRFYDIDVIEGDGNPRPY